MVLGRPTGQKGKAGDGERSIRGDLAPRPRAPGSEQRFFFGIALINGLEDVIKGIVLFSFPY